MDHPANLIQPGFEPSERIRSLIAEILPLLLQRAGRCGLLALALLGSAARAEETWQGEALMGDIDLVAAGHSPSPWVARRFQNLTHGLYPGLEAGYFPLYSLSRYRTLFFYEARHAGWVFWGQTGIFQAVRMQSAEDIPKWEGIRILLNRMVDCLRAAAGDIPPWYAAVKTYLALAQADLVYRAAYRPSYRLRLEQLEAAGDVLGSKVLLERARWATRVKLGQIAPPGQVPECDHQRWLLEGLSALMPLYLGRPVTVGQGMEILARQNFHPLHRLFNLLQHRDNRRGWADRLLRDPAFAFWAQAYRLLYRQAYMPAADLRRWLDDFDRAPQPLSR